MRVKVRVAVAGAIVDEVTGLFASMADVAFGWVPTRTLTAFAGTTAPGGKSLV